MECRSVMIGGIYNIENDSPFKNQTDSRHYYLVVGQYTKSNIGMVQCICITSMYGKEITTELPIVFRGKISYLVPYNIYAFPARDFDNMSYAGGLFASTDDSSSLEEFIELIYDINRDCVVYSFQNKEFHKSVEERYNKYIDTFYSKNKNLREYRFDKFIKNGVVESEDKKFEKIYYGGKQTTINDKILIKVVKNTSMNEINEIDNKKKDIIEKPDFSKIGDEELVTYYDSLLNTTAGDFSRKYSLPSFPSSSNNGRTEKSLLSRVFYNNRHKAKTELVRRGLINKNPADDAINM